MVPSASAACAVAEAEVEQVKEDGALDEQHGDQHVRGRASPMGPMGAHRRAVGRARRGGRAKEAEGAKDLVDHLERVAPEGEQAKEEQVGTVLHEPAGEAVEREIRGRGAKGALEQRSGADEEMQPTALVARQPPEQHLQPVLAPGTAPAELGPGHGGDARAHLCDRGTRACARDEKDIAVLQILAQGGAHEDPEVVHDESNDDGREQEVAW